MIKIVYINKERIMPPRSKPVGLEVYKKGEEVISPEQFEKIFEDIFNIDNMIGIYERYCISLADLNKIIQTILKK